MTIQPASITEADARRLTERIRTAFDRVSTAWADLAERITEAYQRRADLALGYASWAEYAEAELRPSEGIAADVRRQLVWMLSAAGMSTRAIAPTVGVTQKTVVLDTQVIPQVSPAPEPAEPEPVDLATGEVLDPAPQAPVTVRDEAPASPTVEQRDSGGAAPPAPRTVTGLDGKTYTRTTPEPRAERRRALTDTFFDAAFDLNRRVESVRRLIDDDRFTRNASEIAQKHLSDLVHSRDLLQQVIDQLVHEGNQL